MELKTGGLAASPQVLPDDTHLDTYEQVAGPGRVPPGSSSREVAS